MLASLKGDAVPERIARVIWKRAPHHSFVYWAEEKAQFKSDRNRLEALAWASAIDALIESLDEAAFEEEALEIMVRRFLAVHSADSSGNWMLAKQLEMASRSDTLMPSSMLQKIFKNAAATQQLKAGGKGAGASDWFSTGSSRSGRSRGGGKSSRGGRPSGAGDSSDRDRDRDRSASRPRGNGSGRGGRGGRGGGRSSSSSRAPGGAGGSG
jgi:hypothetical protein